MDKLLVVQALFELFERTGSRQYYQRALAVLYGVVAGMKEDNDHTYLPGRKNRVMLRENGLLIYLMIRAGEVEGADPNRYRKELKGLVAFIRDRLLKPGGRATSFYLPESGKSSIQAAGFEIEDAILGLAAYEMKFKDEKQTSAARELFFATVNDYIKGKTRLTGGRIIEGAQILGLSREEVGEQFFEKLIASKSSDQLFGEIDLPESKGGFVKEGSPPRAITAANRLELFVALWPYLLAEEQRSMAERIKGSASFILHLQYDRRSSFYLPNENLTMGGFRESSILDWVRTDAHARAVIALCRLCRMMEDRRIRID